MRKKSVKLVVLVSAIGLASCSTPEAQTQCNAHAIKGDTVFVYSENALQSKIKVEAATTASYRKEVITAGTVQPIPTQFAYIAPPFSGRIVKSYIKLGQIVSANAPLFEIISPDFTSAQKEYYQALAEKELAQKDLARKRDLIKNGVASEKELEEALSTLQVAEKEFENARAALIVYQTNPDKMVLGQPLVIYSPIAGKVIENNIVTGQYVSEDAEPIATVADLSNVWITAQVKEKDIHFIQVGNEMKMNMAAYPGKTITGQVFHVEESVDEDTRSIRVLSVCDNHNEILKIGMYTTIHFYDRPLDIIQIPDKALLQGEKESYVFVEIADNTYVRTPIEVESNKNGMAFIAKGLKEGDKIICEGGYYMN